MGFLEKLKSNLAKLRTVYDLAAFCYDYLIEVVKDQEWFIGQYVLVNDRATKVNPNIKQLARFCKKVECCFMETDCDEEHEALRFSGCMSKIVKAVSSIEKKLQPYEEEELNFATVPLYILYAIDRYLSESQMPRPRRMPKNSSYMDNSYIYLTPKHNILDDAEEQLKFSDVIQPLLIRNQLRNIIILEREELNGKQPPNVVTLQIPQNDKDRRSVLERKKLRIALIPFEKEEMVQFPPTGGGAMFRVEYTEWYRNHGKEYALKMLDMAIRQKANIVVFPEYVCEPSVQKDIGKHLNELYKTKPKFMKNLLLVVAGSGWTDDDNNVSCIYSYNGHLLGKQYKEAKYNKIDEKGNSYVEGLKNPGRETTICEAEGIGDVMFAICRDVSDSRKLAPVVERFRPQFLLVPAWSPSIHKGFEQQLGNFAAQNHRTCSMVCNCCEAFGTFQEKRDIAGIVVTPMKEGSLVKGKADFIPRNAECCIKGACGGCVWMMDLCFEVNKVEKKKIVCGKKQKKCE